MNELEKAKSKLERLKQETSSAFNQGKSEFERIPFGQPNISGRPDIYKTGKRYYKKARKLSEETEKQQRRVDMLEKVQDFKEENDLLKDVHRVGNSSYATVGAKTSVNNLEYFKDKLEKLIAANEEAKANNKKKDGKRYQTYGSDITALKNKIAMLEKMKESDETATIGEHAQYLIDAGLVKKWEKKPIYYFVQGLRKVALVLDENGNFKESPRYAAYTESDKQTVKELLEG